MSAVINKAKSQYRRALGIEVGVILAFAFFLFLYKGNITISFIAGTVSSFVPHAIFVYWVFFRNSAKDRTNMTAFYRGEGLKWLATILLIVGCFKLVFPMDFVWFFMGYFIVLLLNNMIPFLLSRFTH